jgi:heptaprenylglyceryl phosphate synthase
MTNEQLARELKIVYEKLDSEQSHRKELKKDIDAIVNSTTDLVHLIGGSNLNGNKGMVFLLDKIELKVERLEKDFSSIQKSIDNTQFWGKSAIGLFFAGVLLLIKEIFLK